MKTRPLLSAPRHVVVALALGLPAACGEPPPAKLPEGPAPEYEPSRGTTAPKPGATSAPVATSAPAAPPSAPLEPPPSR
jgi:hypothetical protein